MNRISSNPAIRNAFDTVRDFNGPSGYAINTRELRSIINAAKCDDGQVSAAEKKEIAYLLTMTYSNFTPAAARRADAFVHSSGFDPNNPRDFFTP